MCLLIRCLPCHIAGATQIKCISDNNIFFWEKSPVKSWAVVSLEFTESSLPLDQNNPHAKVAHLGEACSKCLQYLIKELIRHYKNRYLPFKYVKILNMHEYARFPSNHTESYHFFLFLFLFFFGCLACEILVFLTRDRIPDPCSGSLRS